ncbi:class I SAM-dependent methyltransferase [Thalassovita sp.]|uniref:SAM-dependent methyltransferase n=1 Tax=Thalassovita sp. TaxID=1979401 RepID=UPI0029DE84A0|nr:class I SAM-dependent methyltransferase [Thalassovita sp.]
MWEERFATQDYVFGKEPARFLVEHASYLTPGMTALSVADGEGRNSVYLAERGLTVTALEFAPSAIRKARLLAAERGVSVDFQNVDVLRHVWPDQFGLVAGIFIQFVGPQQRAELFKGMMASVQPGGLLMLHGYTPEQLKHGTGGPPFAENMYTEALLKEAFSGWDILECRAYEREVQEGRGHVGMSALIDFVARKPA